MFLMFPTDSAGQLAGLLTGSKKEIHILDDLGRSALQEVGNILAGTSINVLSRFLDMNITQSVPETATDMLGSVIDSILGEIGKSSDVVLILKVDFFVEDRKISGKLFFLFDPKSTAKILETAKKKISK
jgi:chemotaxis protein CheC